MIQENIEIHDKHQFEIKMGYKALDQEDALYDIEMYFFIPSSLNVNKHTYLKRDFFNDLQTYIRFKSPVFLLRSVAAGDDSPILKLKRSFQQLADRQDEKTVAHYIRQIKMFACIVKSALRDHVQFTAKQKIADDQAALIDEYIRTAPDLAARYRQLKAIVNVPSLAGKLYSHYLFGDEYLSFLIEESTYGLIQVVEKADQTTQQGRLAQLYGIIRDELRRREASGYPSLPRADGDNEELIFRRSVLKKFTGGVLHLMTTTEREGLLLEQLLFGLAAGFAMMFATAVAFYSQARFGSISLTLFFVLTVSYILKDRIKEWLRLYFSKKIQYLFFDHRINLLTAEKDRIGWAKELFFFAREGNIPKEIMRIRDRDHITEIENGWMGEEVAVYMEKVKIFSKRLLALYGDYRMEGINSIMRFDISKFLNKMDDPQKALCLLDGQGHREIVGKRVYHLNLIVKYTSKLETTYKRFRIVMNREGIKRIEEVFSEQSPGTILP